MCKISNILQDFLQTSGLKKVQLAEKAGISPTLITLICKGQRERCEWNTIRKILIAIRSIDPSYLPEDILRIE